MMYPFVVSLHILLSIILVLVVILQPGKGGDFGSVFGGGGGGGSVFGPRGPTNIFARVTTVVAVMFMVTSITLAWYSDKSMLTGTAGIEAEMERLQQEQQLQDAPGEAGAEVVDPSAGEAPVEAEPAAEDEAPAEGEELEFAPPPAE